MLEKLINLIQESKIFFLTHVQCIILSQVLLAYGADVTAVEKELNSALHFAAEGGFGMICKYLAQRGL